MRTASSLLLILCVAGCNGGPASQAPVSVGTGDFVIEIAPDDKTIALERRGEALLSFGADALRIGTVTTLSPTASYDPFWYETDDGVIGKMDYPADFAWHEVSAMRVTSSDASGATIELTYDGTRTATLTIQALAAGRFSALLAPKATAGSEVAMLQLRPRAGATEGFYGLGEWGDDINHRGHLRPMQLEPDLSLENGSDENHAPVPLLIGTRGWGVFVESKRVGAFDCGRKAPDLVEITYGTGDSSGEGLRFYLFGAERPLDVTKHYYEVTGPPLLPAPWALGPWMWRDENVDEAQFLDDLDQLRDRDLATSAIWIDRPYATAVNTFDFNPAQFPDPQAMIKKAHDLGFRMALWHTPYIEEAAKSLLAEAQQKGYFPPKTSVLTNKWGVPLDFTNKDAYAWWQAKIRKYTDMGIEGFKLDYAEDIVAGIGGNRSGWTFSDGSTDRTMHWGYTRLYHKIYAETLPAAGGYLLCRTGRWGDQANVSVIWPGDLDATWTKKYELIPRGGKMVKGVGGLPVSIAYGLSLGPSGFPFYAADTGGYIHSPPGKELWVRWAEQTALSTVMNVGDSSSQMPWEFTKDNGRDVEALDIYRVYARLHLRLFPYEWTYAKNLAVDGRAITRAFGLVYPAYGKHPMDVYFFGDDLLVAPVVTPGATTRRLPLPPGDWLDWWTGDVYAGGASGGNEVEVPAPLAKLPLLIRRGAIVPLLRPTIDSLSPTTDPARVDSFATDAGPLWVRVVPGADGAFRVYDGTALALRGNRIEVQPGSVFVKGEVFEVIGVKAVPSSVTLDGMALAKVDSQAALDAAASGWRHAPETGGTVLVKVPAGSHAVAWTN